MRLEELRIRNLGVIADATVELVPGLNVLTGETGAGKTMVVSGLQLLLGARADADQVRAGAGRAVVEGRVRPVPAVAAEWVDPDDEELVVAREVAVDGGATRSRVRLGGNLAPVSALTGVMGSLAEVHAQSDSVRLATSAVQRELLDRSGGEPLLQALVAYRDAYHAWRRAEAELDALRADERDRARELDRLRFELDEIAAVAPEPGEEAVLDAHLRRLEHAETLTAAAAAAAAPVTAEGGARDALGVAVAALRAASGNDEVLDGLCARAESLALEAQDLALELTAYADRVELDPARLEELRARRVALSALTRKYGPDAAAVAAYADRARDRLEKLAGGSERAAALDQEVLALRATVEEAAAVLHARREEAGQRVVAEVERHLSDLAMAGARMHIGVEPTEPGADGADRITWLLAANPGEPPLPLSKAASGGERSRIALAVRLALADADDTAVLVFDEVDAGIGGGVAVEVGQKLARLARGRQVVCVTHLAQLAAFGDAHFVVEKEMRRDGRTSASVRRLDEGDRVAELSRMLSGSPDSELAAGHAAELRAQALEALAEAEPAGMRR